MWKTCELLRKQQGFTESLNCVKAVEKERVSPQE